MQRLGHLGRLYTAYPKYRVDGLPKDKVATFPWLMVPYFALGRVGWKQAQDWLAWPVLETFDHWLATHMDACDVLHCLSGFGLRSHRVAKDRYGALTVCDRGSAHIVYQDYLLAEEYEIQGLPYNPIDRRIIEKELHEYAECDLITVPSTFAYRSFVNEGVPKQKLTKVSYGVDLRLFRQIPKEDEIFRVIYAGNLTFQKGIPYLLKAMAELNLPNFELLLLGSLHDEMKPFLVRYDGCFNYAGFIPRTELYRYYSQGSVFVLPSIQDGFGMVLAQAMACGLPVVATTNTGAQDLITDGVEGFIVPIRQPEALSEKVLYLYEHPDVREEMSQAALRRVKSLGGWDAYGEKTATAYETALAAIHAGGSH